MNQFQDQNININIQEKSKKNSKYYCKHSHSCCIGCVVFTIIILIGLGIMIYFFYPRGLTMKTDQSELATATNNTFAYDSNTGQYSYQSYVPVIINNKNLYSIGVYKLEIDIIYQEQFLGYGANAEIIQIPKQGNVTSTILMAAYSQGAQSPQMLAAYNEDCGPFSNRTMIVDLHIKILDVRLATFIKISNLEIYLSDVEMNCPQ